MNKRFQVFISSTFADLKEERSKVIQTIMELDCIPAGMEIFPAIDEEQFEFIKKVIDDCDYYILIIGGRYGTLSNDGISYTEKEYDYATDKGIKVIAFIHANPDAIPLGKSEKDNTSREKLEAFKKKISTGRLVKFWSNAEELPGLVALSLSKTIKTYPAIGWVRGNTISNVELLQELNEQRKENQDLKINIKNLQESIDQEPVFSDLAELEQEIEIFGKSSSGSINNPFSWSVKISWREIFYLISPYLLEHPSDEVVKKQLADEIFKRAHVKGYSPSLNAEQYQTIKIQLKLHKLIDITYSKSLAGGAGLFWHLTKKGEIFMYEIRSVRKGNY
ncbi:hypothetical protein CMT52_05145 [Elizabethkingia anophelis]|nr:hypothetical protein [Elizabethkingia anophelis]MDV4023719.1 hypothetical protein [Elizabethkingia anophelis]